MYKPFSLKSDGRFVDVCTGNPDMQIRNVWDMMKFIPGILFRPMTSKIFPFSPDYANSVGGTNRQLLDQALKLVADGKVKVIMDTNSPHVFDTKGVRAALGAVDGKHAHGKVVVDLERS